MKAPHKTSHGDERRHDDRHEKDHEAKREEAHLDERFFVGPQPHENHRPEVVQAVDEHGDRKAAPDRTPSKKEPLLSHVVPKDRAHGRVHGNGRDATHHGDDPSSLGDVHRVLDCGKAEGGRGAIHDSVDRLVEALPPRTETGDDEELEELLGDRRDEERLVRRAGEDPERPSLDGDQDELDHDRRQRCRRPEEKRLDENGPRLATHVPGVEVAEQ